MKVKVFLAQKRLKMLKKDTARINAITRNKKLAGKNNKIRRSTT